VRGARRGVSVLRTACTVLRGKSPTTGISLAIGSTNSRTASRLRRPVQGHIMHSGVLIIWWRGEATGGTAINGHKSRGLQEAAVDVYLICAVDSVDCTGGTVGLSLPRLCN